MNNFEAAPTPIFSQKLWILITIALVFGGVLASSIWIFKPYSYWLDELYSVTAANESFNSLHTILLKDVHPPLYQFFLKVWILLFGDSELSTRILSWGFATAAAVYLFLKTYRYDKIFCAMAVLFFTTNWLYAFYANETRAYSMTLFLVTVMVTNMPLREGKPSPIFLLSGFLLSLTHYFGLLITGVVLAVHLLQNLKRPRVVLPLLLIGCLCLIWPLYHMLVGDLLNKTDGNFWIKVNGIFDSLKIAASGYIPRTGKLGGIILVAGLLTVLVITRTKTGWKNNESLALSCLTRTTAIVSLAFLALVATLDLWSPISTTRNYIVLLPLLSISIAGAITLLASNYPKARKLLSISIAVFCSLTLLVSFYQTYKKSTAYQDWRGASLYILNNHNSRNIFYITNSETNIWRHLVANFYLKKFSNNTVEAQPYVIGITKIETPSMILFGHSHSMADAIEREMQALGANQSYERDGRIDIRKGAVGVYIVD